jgi:hypothetical protein
MKKIILVVLMVIMVATPCLAHELETDGIFSIEGTVWRATYIFPLIDWMHIDDIGFYGGSVYWGDPKVWQQLPNSFYVNALVVSFSTAIMGDSANFIISTCVMQPLGIGVITNIGYDSLQGFMLFQIGILHKINDDWALPAQIIDISPYQGKPGTTLTNVTIKAIRTTFQDNPPVEIRFDPPNGLTVSNINVINDTEIVFDLKIAVDAPAGYRNVIVTYDNGNKGANIDFLVL